MLMVAECNVLSQEQLLSAELLVGFQLSFWLVFSELSKAITRERIGERQFSNSVEMRSLASIESAQKCCFRALFS